MNSGEYVQAVSNAAFLVVPGAGLAVSYNGKIAENSISKQFK